MRLDAYEILGVPDDVDAGELRSAYRRLARELHPDVSIDPDDVERFTDLAESYELLSDPERRADLDARRTRLKEFRDRRPAARDRQQPGDHLVVPVALDPRVAVHGGAHEITVEVMVTCTACDGAGAADTAEVGPCGDCRGKGHRIHRQATPEGEDQLTWRACRTCAATGTTLVLPCDSCEGSGRHLATRAATIELPADLGFTERLHVPGWGHAGRCGGPHGDLVLETAVVLQSATA